MGCSKVLALNEASTGETPLDDAVYVPGVDKIFGMMGPHLIKFNATTGARESVTRIFSPAYGPCRLCYHAATGLLYVSIWNIQNKQWLVPPMDWAQRGIYPVDPNSLVVGSVIDITATFSGDYQWSAGPRQVMSAGGTYLYFTSAFTGAVATPTELWRIDPTNVGDNFNPSDGSCITGEFAYYQISTDGTNIYGTNGDSQRIQKWNLLLTDASYDFCAINAPYLNVDTPVSVEWGGASAIGICYAVCGTANMLRVDAFGGGNNFTALDLTSLTADPKPVRIRRDTRVATQPGKLYIPLQSDNAIVIWDQQTDQDIDADLRTGFDSPIDVVFTLTKAWAVQSGLTALKEIV